MGGKRFPPIMRKRLIFFRSQLNSLREVSTGPSLVIISLICTVWVMTPP